MITGTCYFYDKEGAYFYYRKYGMSKTEVNAKLARGEIKIGHPDVKQGERVYLNHEEMRYFVESTNR